MYPYILRLPFFVDGGDMVFYRSAEVQPGIEETCKYGVVFCEDMDEFLQTEDR